VAEKEASAKKAATASALRKGMYECSQFAQIIAALQGLKTSAAYESYREGDSSPVPQALDACISMCAGVLKQMIDEEVAEAGETSVPQPVMEMAAQCGELAKHEGDPLLVLVKYGARNSTTDKGRIDAIHKAAVELGADCTTAKADGAGDLQKSAGEGWTDNELEKGDVSGHEFHGNQYADEGGKSEAGGKTKARTTHKDYSSFQAAAKKLGAKLSSANNVTTARVGDRVVGEWKAYGGSSWTSKADGAGDLQKSDTATLEKLVADAVAPLQKALVEAEDKIKKLEAQPMPTRVSLRAVSKAQDNGEAPGSPTEAYLVKDAHGAIHPAASLIKQQFGQGGTPLVYRG